MPPRRPNSTQNEQDGALREMYRLSGLGTELVGAIVFVGGLGWLLDRWLGTSPWLMLSGTLVGLAVGMYNFIWQALIVARRPVNPPKQGFRPYIEDEPDDDNNEPYSDK